jgi:transcription elongation GreA/GreB family factor
VPPSFKQQVHEHCQQIVAGKLHALQEKLQDLADSAANETKSSAGDKFETARAMLHIEQDQVRRQIAELKAQLSVLNGVDPTLQPECVVLGSLVRIQDAWYYLSIGLGKVQVAGETVFILSPQSPLGQQLKGLSLGDDLSLNGRKMVVTKLG